MSQHRVNCRILLRGLHTLIDHPIDLVAFFRPIHSLINLNFPITAFEYQQADPIAITAQPVIDHARRSCHFIQ
jgi:hypothetical protein